MKTKFRGKVLSGEQKKGTWAYGYYIKKWRRDSAGGSSIRHYIYDFARQTELRVEAESVGQWTGKCDKNKVDLYLNDIVYSTYDGYYGVIKQMNGGAYYIDQPDTCLEYAHQIHCEVCETDGPTFFLSHLEGWEIEITGNTTDNPELSKGETQ